MRFARLLLLLGCFTAPVTAAHAVPFTSLFVFGDSNSDNGRRLQLQGTKPASPPYYEGRHSNGPVAVEYLASHTSSLDPCYTGNLLGMNGSVCSDPDRYVFWDPNGHLTAPAQQIMGNLMIAAIPEPASLAPLGMALAGIGVGRSRARRDHG